MEDDRIKLLEHLGLSHKSVESVRFARGVVGNTTIAVVAMLVAIPVVAWSLHTIPWLAAATTFGILVFGVFYILGTWKFADKHPDLALFGGAELLTYRQMQMAAKGVMHTRDAPIIENPVKAVALAVKEPSSDA